MKKTFTKLFLIFGIALATTSADAQTDSVKTPVGGKNLVKISLTSLALNNYSFIYERKIAKKISLGLGYRIMPEGGFPFKSSFESIIDDEDTYQYIDDLRTSNFSITPEVKFYFGKDVFRGFYIAPFARYSNFKASLPFEYTFEEGGIEETKTIPLDAEIKGISGGLLFGAQWKLSRLVYLDWSILGPHYGSADGNIVGKMALNSEAERQAVREEIEDLLDTDEIDKTIVVDKDGANVDLTGPWGGIRASISIGFRF